MRKHKHKQKTQTENTNTNKPIAAVNSAQHPYYCLSSSTFAPTLLVPKKIFAQNAKQITFVPTKNCGNGRIDILATGYY